MRQKSRINLTEQENLILQPWNSNQLLGHIIVLASWFYMLWFYSHQLIMSVNNSYIKCRLGRHIFAPIVIHSCVTLVSHCFVICTLLHLPSQVYTCPVRHSSVTEPAPPDRNVWCGGDQVLSVARWNVDPSLSMRLFSSNQLIRCNVYNPS